MILYPAIDLKDGNCVRLLRGDMSAATVFNEDPASQARAFQDAGCQWIHVVDLNGAFEGRPVNSDAVERIVAAVDVDVQLGGGIRTLETIEHWLSVGLSRVILGTVVVKNPALVVEACRHFPGRIAISIDARGGWVAIEGWAADAALSVLDLARRFEGAGAAAIVYTDIDKDGAMEGPNVAATRALAEAVSIPVIASGGISSMADLETVRREIPNLNGAISGRAIYDGKIDITSAVELLSFGAGKPTC